LLRIDNEYGGVELVVGGEVELIVGGGVVNALRH